MKKSTLILMVAATMAYACGGNEAVTEQQAESELVEDEWVSLFDGQTFNGWSRYGGGEVGKAWKIQDGAIYLDASNKEDWQTGDGGDIVTDEEFENYHLRLEWKIAPNGNSGIIFNVKDTATYQYPWQTGMEMQVLDNDGHPDAKIRTHRAGDLYDLIESSEETVKPVGEWNLAEVKVDNGNLEMFLNGVMVVSTTLWTPEWEEMVANSKFKDMPAFGTIRKGKIALQDHGDEVWFRNIQLKKLD